MNSKYILGLSLIFLATSCSQKMVKTDYIRKIDENTKRYFTSSIQIGRHALEENQKLLAEWQSSDGGRSERAIRISRTLNLLSLFKVYRDLNETKAADECLEELQTLLSSEREKMPKGSWVDERLTSEGAYAYAVYVDDMFRKANPELRKQ
jgi:hypothetical protein